MSPLILHHTSDLLFFTFIQFCVLLMCQTVPFSLFDLINKINLYNHNDV